MSVRVFVRGRLEGFALRQAARAEKRKQQRAKLPGAADSLIDDPQACLDFSWTPEERRAQMISFAYGNVKLHNPAFTREDVERACEQLTSGDG